MRIYPKVGHTVHAVPSAASTLQNNDIKYKHCSIIPQQYTYIAKAYLLQFADAMIIFMGSQMKSVDPTLYTIHSHEVSD